MYERFSYYMAQPTNNRVPRKERWVRSQIGRHERAKIHLAPKDEHQPVMWTRIIEKDVFVIYLYTKDDMVMRADHKLLE
jgi:hypothetical protein